MSSIKNCKILLYYAYKKEVSQKGIMFEQCVSGGEYVCTLIADVDSCVVVDFGLFMVE